MIGRDQHQTPALVGIALVSLAVALAFGAADGTTAAVKPTKARIFHAFGPRGKARFPTKTRQGRCGPGSVAINRRDAWRCGAGHRIHDPCFSSPRRPGFVLCPNAPWEHAGVRLKLTSPLPRKDANKRRPSLTANPWGLELYDGRRCLLQTRATTVIGDQRANYDCGKGKDWLWGRPDRRSEPWTIFSAPYGATALTEQAQIRRAWM